MSDAALQGAYCASFWQSIVDDYEALIQGLPSSPPQGLQDGISEARRELKRTLDYKVGAMTQHIAVQDLIELLVAENQAGDGYEACAQMTQRSIQRLLKDPDIDRKTLLQQPSSELRRLVNASIDARKQTACRSERSRVPPGRLDVRLASIPEATFHCLAPSVMPQASTHLASMRPCLDVENV
jgi:hypothetical protein